MNTEEWTAFSQVAVLQQAALYAVLLCCCCRGLFSAWNRMVNREHSGGWALQCTAVLVALLCTPTLFHSCSASDNLSISYSISLPFSGQWLYHLSSLISSLQIRYVLFLPASLNTLMVDCNRYFPCCLLYCSFKLPYPLFLTCTSIRLKHIYIK